MISFLKVMAIGLWCVVVGGHDWETVSEEELGVATKRCKRCNLHGQSTVI